MSLKDPISTLKMTTPCRSTICTHDRCFDAESFLQLQEQAPMWQCPICNKTISFEALAVDEYVQEILEKVPRGTDQVTIEPDGRWSSDSGIPTSGNNAYDDDDSDSDEEPINHHNRVGAIKSESIATPLSMARTPLASPSMASREASSVPRTGSKRGSEVIDLTLSDDDEPVRPRKKVAYSTPNSLPDRQYQMPFYGGRSNLSTPHIPAHSSHNTIPLSGSARMEPPAPHHQHRHSYGSAYPTQPQPPPPPRQSYPGQGSPSSSSYPTYIGSSP
jgi:E3 SUMO-protein ligase PIAS1